MFPSIIADPQTHPEEIFPVSATRATESEAPSVQKWVIDSDIEQQLRSRALLDRIRD